MPRTARTLSASNIYHVMVRGVNRQDIFESDGDRQYYLSLLQECKDISGFRLHAFCLMSNHIHLLIEPGSEPLNMIFRRVGTRYAVWYNRKYQRAGHLFQDRFRSENVESEQYYRTVLRYILQNPMKAGLESRPGSYRWSSYRAYAHGAGVITDTEYALNVFGGREALIHFVQQSNDDVVMDEKDGDWRFRDEEAKEIMAEISKCSDAAEFRALLPTVQKEYVQKMYLKRLSMNQISRLTGVPKGSVFRMVQGLQPEPPEIPDSPALREPDDSDFTPDDTIIW